MVLLVSIQNPCDSVACLPISFQGESLGFQLRRAIPAVRQPKRRRAFIL